jgi:N utilization substance protein B
MMKKIRKKIIREKAIIAVYQYLLVGTTEDEIRFYLESDTSFSKDKSEFTYCFSFILKVIERHEIYMQHLMPLLKKDWTIDRLSKMELAILLVATCEIVDEKIDKKVVINEAVEMSKRYCDDTAYKFINGILNKVE